ncbi:MAG: hypothetical protein DI598_01645 [Pseudopedobacter saltans]|uniref:Cobalamin-independent methionine synthase MetE N-terminal domain-containing protein n=1 Tax=Pseudopedobacter saltans TaxID=151895 RepID=A0A2W5FEK9_9SPHI|nr:MAG: hypothetical protein DI598_01645 [Pseudopedobacter saltans]
MKTHNLGYPRIGNNRELKKAEEAYWTGKSEVTELLQVAKEIRLKNWNIQKDVGIQFIPVNDFSFYDQMLDMSLMVGAIPRRFHDLMQKQQLRDIDLLFAMARGYQKNGFDIKAMEMTKWFDTNYHYIVPEFTANQNFVLYNSKIINEFVEAKQAGINAKPVLIGAFTYLYLGKEKNTEFSRFELIHNILEVYIEILNKLENCGAQYIQFDEPALSLNLTDAERSVIAKVYSTIRERFPNLKIILASYFECYGDNIDTVLHLPIDVLHLDLVRCENQLSDILQKNISNRDLQLSLGVVDGRNIWQNDFKKSLALIENASNSIGKDRIWIAPSCSLLHSPCDLELEKDERILKPEIKQWLAFAKQKIEEVVILAQLASGNADLNTQTKFQSNIAANELRKTSSLIHNPTVKNRVEGLTEKDDKRHNSFNIRKKLQHFR